MKEQLVQVRYGYVERNVAQAIAENDAGWLNSYTYRTRIPLKVGDVVEVPPTARQGYQGDPPIATVVGIGSDWAGPTHEVIRKHRHRYVRVCACCGKEHG